MVGLVASCKNFQGNSDDSRKVQPPEETVSKESPKLLQLEGRSYYIIEEGYKCGYMGVAGPQIETWKDRIDFGESKFTKWGNGCNDAPIPRDYNADEFMFSDDLSRVTYNGKIYFYYKDKPEF